jgi:membrane fusion protein (multidrug efflux system)
MAEDQNPPADEQDKNNNERKRPGKKPLIILGIVVVVMVVVALVWWFLTRNEETTDDAFTDGDVVTIAPKTAGYVTELRVRDNQRVKKAICWWLSIRVIPPRSAIRLRPSLGWLSRSCIRPRRSWRSQSAVSRPA